MKLRAFNSSLAYVLTLIVGSVSTAHAAPGDIDIAQQPLFLQNAVSPNIFFLNDNSGSMRWELMTTNYEASGRLKADSDTPALIENPSCNTTNNTYGFILQTSTTTSCNTVAEEEWRARFHEYNALYYNPNRVYNPWAGNDADGSPLFKAAKINKAKIDPNNPDSEELDLTKDSAVLVTKTEIKDSKEVETFSRTYYSEISWTTWCGTQGIATNDCKGWRYYDRNAAGVMTMMWAHQLTTDADKTNFANWFTYHRSREFSAKYALSLAIEKSSPARIGYATINNDNHIRIDHPDALRTDADTTTHTQDVLSKLFNTSSPDPTTPLRSNLQAAGEYYKTGELSYFDPTFNNGFGQNKGKFFLSADNPSTRPIIPEDKGGACQSNNTILMTDGIYNGNLPTKVGNVDSDNKKPYSDIYDDTLADVAMYYYENDLATVIPDLTDDMLIYEKDYTPEIDDTALHQHMNTHTLAFGLAGNISKPTAATINDADFSWKNPVANSAERIDDLFHAAVNGRGHYASAADPNELEQALREIINNITKGTTQSATSVALSAFYLEDSSLAYFSRFSTGDWTGELEANQLDFDETDGNKLSFTVKWEAGEELAKKDIADRIIYTSKNNAGVTFEWDNISTDMQTALKAGDSDVIGEARLNFLRGDANADASLTDTDFRKRKSLLGDIVNSSPVYVGAPASPYPDSAPFGIDSNRYFKFWDKNKDRTKMLYVGANDGMLHGFDAKTGEEKMAYVPATVAENLHKLTDPDYIHHFFVDATPTVSDAYFSSDWHTVLVSGLGGGGQGLFALDVTDPANFTEAKAASNALWEFNSTNDADLGYSFSKPTIALLENNKWAVIVGNGYNSANGIATLFIIYLDAKPTNGNWIEDTHYRKIRTTTVASPGDKNGLSTPTAVDSDGDGYVDRVYAGDLKGNMWAFSLTGDTSKWDITYQKNSKPQPLFQAKNAAGKVQAITAKPSIIRHPFQPTITATENSTPNLMVLFGTGQYLGIDDLDNLQTQSFYGIWDKGLALDQNNNGLSRDNLVAQTIIEKDKARVTTNNDIPYGIADNKKRFGWYIDLNKTDAATGERVVNNAVVINDVAFFTTYIPNIDPCGTGGDSWFMFLNAANGAYPTKPVISINGDRLINDKDLVKLTDGDATAPSGLKIEGTLGSPSIDMGDSAGNGTALLNTNDGVKDFATDIGNHVRGKRISWRELR